VLFRSLVPPGDAAGFAEALARVLTDADLAGRLSATGRAHAARYDWGTVADQVERAYRDAVAARGAGLR